MIIFNEWVRSFCEHEQTFVNIQRMWVREEWKIGSAKLQWCEHICLSVVKSLLLMCLLEVHGYNILLH